LDPGLGGGEPGRVEAHEAPEAGSSQRPRSTADARGSTPSGKRRCSRGRQPRMIPDAKAPKSWRRRGGADELRARRRGRFGKPRDSTAGFPDRTEEEALDAS
jgi:hypothetical protein